MPELHTLLTGVAFGESPRWHDGRLWFSDWGAQEVVAVDLDGNSEVVLRVRTTLPFSIDWLPDGCLLVVSGPEALLLRREPDGSLVTHADLSSLDRNFNEIVVDGRGNAVNSIGFDLLGDEEFAPGIVALITPDGSARAVADGIAFGNGMLVNPDHAILIVAESYGNRLTAFDIAADGSLSNRRVWADLGDGVPDGFCLDADTPSSTPTYPTSVACGCAKAARCGLGVGTCTLRPHPVDLDHGDRARGRRDDLRAVPRVTLTLFQNATATADLPAVLAARGALTTAATPAGAAFA